MHIPTLHRRRGLLFRPSLGLGSVLDARFICQISFKLFESGLIAPYVRWSSGLALRHLHSQLVDFLAVQVLHNVKIRPFGPYAESGEFGFGVAE
jgi:hypothetical protein